MSRSNADKPGVIEPLNDVLSSAMLVLVKGIVGTAGLVFIWSNCIGSVSETLLQAFFFFSLLVMAAIWVRRKLAVRW